MIGVGVLGELELVRGGKRLALPASKKSRALLGFLVVTGRPQLREDLCDLLWLGPDDPRAALRWSLTKLRALVDEAKATRLVADRERVAFEPRGAAVDLAEARALFGDGDAPTEALVRAASLFRGEFLAGLDMPDCYRYHEWCVAEREAARGMRIAILSALVERLDDAPEDALVHARARVAVDPLAEAAHVHVIRLLARLGRPREALAQYETCARILANELGTRPSPALIQARALVGAPRSSSAPPPPPPPAPAEAAPASRPAEGPASVRQTLVGRLDECALIAGAVRVASERARPQPALLFLGESGIGKTRLLQRVADEVRAAGGLALSGRAFEAEMVRPYGPWIDALRALAAGRASEALEPYRADLAPLLPEFGGGARSSDDAGDAGDASDAGDRSRLFDAVARVAAGLGARAPFAVLLDDLQWLDDASAALLHHVARKAAPGVVVACASRRAELGDNAPVQRLVRALARAGQLVERDLAPLVEGDVVELARAFGVDGGRVFAESRGHPYFALEIASALARGDDGGEGVVTESLGAMLDERFDRLGPGARSLVPWAAALSRGFDLDRLAGASSLPAPELLAAVEELEAHRVLVVTEGGRGYDFAHDFVRARAYGQLSEPRRRLIHLQIARSLGRGATAADGLPPELAGEIAHHAALGGDHDLAARAALAGGRHALRIFANQEAARLARFGIEHTAQLPESTALALRVALLDVVVHSSVWVGRAGALEGELARVIQACERVGLAAAAAAGFQALSVLQHDGGKFDLAHASVLSVAEASRSVDPMTRAERVAFSAKCLLLIERDVPLACALLDEARALVEGLDAELLEVHWATGLRQTFTGERAAGIASLERTLQLARQQQSRWSQFETLMTLARIDLEDGRPDDALARCPELADVASHMAGDMGGGSERAVAAALEALARTTLGQESADGRLAGAVGALRMLDAKGALAFVLTRWAHIELAAGKADRARARAREAVRAAEALKRRSQAAAAHALLGSIALALGDRALALEELGRATVDWDVPLALAAHTRAGVETLAASLGVPAISTTAETPAPTASPES